MTIDKIYLQNIINSELLNDETKVKIQEEVAKIIAEKEKEIEEKLSASFDNQISEYIDTVDSILTESLSDELKELRDDLENSVQPDNKGNLSILEEQYNAKIDVLVDAVHQFLTERLEEEIGDLKEDLEISKKNDFGMQLYNSFSNTFAKDLANSESLITESKQYQSQIKELQEELTKVKSQTLIKESSEQSESKLLLEEVKNLKQKVELLESENSTFKSANKDLRKKVKIEKVISVLTGTQKESMRLLLESSSIEKVEENYKKYLPKVLNTNNETKKVLRESKVLTGDLTQVDQEKSVEDKEYENQLSLLLKNANQK